MGSIVFSAVFAMPSNIASFFGASGYDTSMPTSSDNIALAPSDICPNKDPDALFRPDQFRLQGRQYIRCATLARGLRKRKRMSMVWTYGEDLQLQEDSSKKVWYCYICEKEKCQ